MHLHLTDIYALQSLLMIVLVLRLYLFGSLVQMPMSVKHASAGKYPVTSLFPAGPFFAFALSPTPTPLHSILLGFIFETIYFSK